MGVYSPRVRLSGASPGAAFLGSALDEFKDVPFRQSELERLRLENVEREMAIEDALAEQARDRFVPPTTDFSTVQPFPTRGEPDPRVIMSGGTEQRFRDFEDQLTGAMGQPDTGLPTLQAAGRQALPALPPGDVTASVAEALGTTVPELLGVPEPPTVEDLRGTMVPLPGGRGEVPLFGGRERVDAEIEELIAAQQQAELEAERQRQIELQIAGDPGTSTPLQAERFLSGQKDRFGGFESRRAEFEAKLAEDLERARAIEPTRLLGKYPPAGPGAGVGGRAAAGGVASLTRDANNRTAALILGGMDPIQAADQATTELGTAPDLNAVNKIVDTLDTDDLEFVERYGLPATPLEQDIWEKLVEGNDPSEIFQEVINSDAPPEEVDEARTYLNGQKSFNFQRELIQAIKANAGL